MEMPKEAINRRSAIPNIHMASKEFPTNIRNIVKTQRKRLETPNICMYLVR
jgi:hypothetical protein